MTIDGCQSLGWDRTIKTEKGWPGPTHRDQATEGMQSKPRVNSPFGGSRANHLSN